MKKSKAIVIRGSTSNTLLRFGMPLTEEILACMVKWDAIANIIVEIKWYFSW